MKKTIYLFTALLSTSTAAFASDASMRERCRLLNEADRNKITDLTEYLAQEKDLTQAGREICKSRISFLKTSIQCRNALLGGTAAFERFARELPVFMTDPALIKTIQLPSEAHATIARITAEKRIPDAASSAAAIDHKT